MKREPSDAVVSRRLLWAIAILAVTRLISLAVYPLMDTTEARYGDIARRMVERSDWITPWFTDSQPFWGKPPLSFWATALGFKLFGINEFAGRLPHFLLSLMVGGLVWVYAKRHSARTAWHAVALLSATLLYVVSSGAVMTDMSLTLGTTLVMIGFWRSLRTDAGKTWPWQAIMALGLTIGLLGKGPLALVLCGMPICFWLIRMRRALDAWRRVAWLSVVVFVMTLSLPWYLMAELRTPGFLSYFLVGEHWHRFIDPGWTGDKYGAAHAFPRGYIWIFALMAIAPWPALLALLAFFKRGPQFASSSVTNVNDGERLYLLLWGLWPCLFFTLSGNAIWTYVLPALPALAILLALWTSTQSGKAVEDLLAAGVWICTASVVVALLVASKYHYYDRNSAKALVADYKKQARSAERLFYFGDVPFSASFYSDGQAQKLEKLEELDAKWPGQVAFVAMPGEQREKLPAGAKLRFKDVSRHGLMLLLRWQ